MKILFIDIETTGLALSDRLLEIGCVLTDELLHPIDTFNMVIGCSEQRLQQMEPVVQDMHRETGLWNACLASVMHEEDAQRALGNWLERQPIEPDETVMPSGAGFDHFDRPFLRAHGWHGLLHRLHYGSIDVSPIRRLLQLVHPDAEVPFDGGGYGPPHRARADAAHAMRQAQVYAEIMRLGWTLLVEAEKALGPTTSDPSTSAP